MNDLDHNKFARRTKYILLCVCVCVCVCMETTSLFGDGKQLAKVQYNHLNHNDLSLCFSLSLCHVDSQSE